MIFSETDSPKYSSISSIDFLIKTPEHDLFRGNLNFSTINTL